MIKNRLNGIFSREMAKYELSMFGLISAGALAYALKDFLGETVFHASGLAAGAVYGFFQLDQLKMREAGLEEVLGKVDSLEDAAQSMENVDEISKGYLDTALKECKVAGDSLEADDNSISPADTAFDAVLMFVFPSYAYVSLASYFLFMREGIARATSLERKAYDDKIKNASQYVDWAKERNQALGERDV